MGGAEKRKGVRWLEIQFWRASYDYKHIRKRIDPRVIPGAGFELL